MHFYHKLKSHWAEPIIRLLAYQVLFIFFTAALVQYAQYHAERYYQKPAREVITNQDNKGYLANIIIRDFYAIESGYRAMLLFENSHRIKMLARKLDGSIEHIRTILQVLENGGTATDSLQVNFYDKDEFLEKVTYLPSEGDTIHVEMVNLIPKLAELKEQFSLVKDLLLKSISSAEFESISDDFRLTLAIKQTEALLLRARESANRLFYDIKLVNIASQKIISQTQVKVNQIVLGIRFVTNFLVVFLALLIALKIFKLLQKQKRIQVRNHWLSAVVDQSPSSILITDIEGHVEYVNAFFEKQTGYSFAEVEGESTRILKSGEVPDAVFKEMWQTIAAGGIWRGELCNKAKDQHLFYEEAVISPVFDDHGTIINYAAIKLDITEKKALDDRHAALQVEQERLTAILDKVPVGIVIIGEDRGIRWVNDFVINLSGFEYFTDIDGQQLFCSAEPDSGFELNLESRRENVEIFLSAQNGQKYPILLSMQPINWCGEDVVLISFIDLSARKKLEAELAQKSKFESVGYLAAGIAHEINTPMQFIKHNLHYLRDSCVDLFELLDLNEKLRQQVLAGAADQETLASISAAREAADMEFLAVDMLPAIDDSIEGTVQVAEIVKTLKEFSHPGSAEKLDTEINRLISNTITVTKNEWKYVANMTTDLSPQLALVPCLVNELNQVLLNLIVNARDAIAERKGQEPDLQGEINIRTLQDDGWVEIRVSDNGTGIPQAVQDKIFDSFFTTKEVGSGTGQGLSISRSIIVDKHQGAMLFETQPGEGTTLIVRLPALVEELGGNHNV
ncbi:MAG: PAS domain S-box protein [Thermodesulfobacteriota bacterium]|nr:PAS domain S-box protein [Thermodesulfobacteriota bacterium]